MPNIATNLSKNNDFAYSVHLSFDMSSYYENLEIDMVYLRLKKSVKKLFLVAFNKTWHIKYLSTFRRGVKYYSDISGLYAQKVITQLI